MFVLISHLISSGFILGVIFTLLGYTIDLPTYFFTLIGYFLGMIIVERHDIK